MKPKPSDLEKAEESISEYQDEINECIVFDKDKTIKNIAQAISEAREEGKKSFLLRELRVMGLIILKWME